jgi:hypothetical protein
MGFTDHSALLSGKDVVGPEPAPGWAGFVHHKVAIEGHALQYSTIALLDGPYKACLAEHLFNNTRITSSNFQFVCNKHTRQVVKSLLDLGIHVRCCTEFPVPDGLEEKLPSIVDFILEQPYSHKQVCSEERLSKSKAQFNKEPLTSASLPDCVTRHVAGTILSQYGVVTTVPGGEFDGTCAGRLLLGFKVISFSCDSDLMVWPMGRFSGMLYYVQRKRSKLGVKMVRCITWQRKAAIMQEVLGLTNVDLLVVDPAVLVWVEMVYLATACTTPHDYNYCKGLNGDGSTWYKNAADPRMTKKPFMKLLVVVGDLVMTHLMPNSAKKIATTTVQEMIASAITLVSGAMVDIDAKYEAKVGDLQSAMRGFMAHPVSISHLGDEPALPYDKLLSEHLEWSRKRRSSRQGAAASQADPLKFTVVVGVTVVVVGVTVVVVPVAVVLVVVIVVVVRVIVMVVPVTVVVVPITVAMVPVIVVVVAVSVVVVGVTVVVVGVTVVVVRVIVVVVPVTVVVVPITVMVVPVTVELVAVTVVVVPVIMVVVVGVTVVVVPVIVEVVPVIVPVTVVVVPVTVVVVPVTVVVVGVTVVVVGVTVVVVPVIVVVVPVTVWWCQ